MILIFDLDDTLYDEMSYVMSGFRAVAKFGETSFGWDAEHSFSYMKNQLLIHGRGKVFDEWLKHHDHLTAKHLKKCIQVYRHHLPDIKLYPAAQKILQQYKEHYPLYLVTDGHKIAQQRKVEALNLDRIFKRVLITHRFGIKNAKPSLHCFNIIKKSEQCEWSEMVYVGDNPAKDFVNLNKMGALTVRVSTGSHSKSVASYGYDALIRISNLNSLSTVIKQN